MDGTSDTVLIGPASRATRFNLVLSLKLEIAFGDDLGSPVDPT